jgi:hypothetical protein
MLSIDKAWTTSLANQTSLTWGVEKNQSSFADGQSWFDHPDKDLSGFANSGKMLILRDSAGRLSWGYIGGAGTGQTLGSERAPLAFLSPPWATQAGTIIDDNSFSAPATAGIKANIFTVKKLYKLSYSNDNANLDFRAFDGSTTANWIQFATGLAKSDIYYSCYAPITYLYLRSSVTGTYNFTDISAKEVLTPSTKGVYIYKDAARTLQGWNMEASFNMNDSAYTFDVVNDCQAEGTVVLDWVPGYIPPASQIGIVSCNAAVDSLLSVAASGSVTRSMDGTAAITGGATLVSGTQRRLVLRWGGGKYKLSSIASGVVTHGTEGNFDGAFTLGTDLLLHYSNAYPGKYSGLKIFRRKLSDAELVRL